ncbi:MAG: response regulator transcription factor, partial [Ignavibacteriaceae bacterium]|nr:response regulator transcription factor [Ignavibacteriaceae bacterium]
MRCLIIESELFSRKILEKFISQTPFLQFLGAVQGTVEALNFLSTAKVDLIFLDIEIQGSSGVQFLNALKEKPCIILTTEKESNTSESFSHEIVDCLLKPINYQQFLKAVIKAKEIIEENRSGRIVSDHIFVKVDSRFVKVSFDSVLYIEAQGDYITIFTKEAKYVIYSTMKNIELSLIHI